MLPVSLPNTVGPRYRRIKLAIAQEKLLYLYRQMVKNWLFGKRWQNSLKGENLGNIHSYVGQEAISVGILADLSPQDYMASTHRGHGHLIAKGGDLKRMMAELYGKATGYCKGKGGSMHVADFSIGSLGANGIVGGGIAMATGAALANKLDGSNAVTVAFGDGASNQG